MTVAAQAKRDAFKYDQVSQHISTLVEQGTLQPGDKAPSLRKLSKQLGVSIATVNQAYLQLEDQGLLKAKPQSGFFVTPACQQIAEITRPKPTCCSPRKVKFGELFEEVFFNANNADIAPFGAAKPSMDLMPAKALVRASKSIASRHPESCLDYCFPPGHEKLRRQIAMLYLDVGITVSPDDIIITSGATEALSLSLQAVAKRGDVIAVESPTYFSMLRLIEKMGMLALEIDTDPETGIMLDSLQDALDTMDIKAMMTVPNFNNPLGSCMPDDNKRRLVEMLAERNIPLIEDDVYGDLYFDGSRPTICKHFDTASNVLTCSSFSKTIAPGYRIGWVLAGDYRDQLMEWKQATFSATASLPQMAISEFLASGQYERHLTRLRLAFREQVEKGRYLIAQHFPEGTRISRPSGGFVLWVELPRPVNCIEVFNLALEKGIGITPGILFSATRRYRNFIRINCGFPWSDENQRAIADLGEIVADLSG